MKTDSTLVYDLIPSSIGEVGIVRRSPKGARSIRMIFLPHEGASTSERILEIFLAAVPSSGKRDKTGMQIEAYLAGDAVNFSIDELDFEGCGEFERHVLLAVHQIPCGRVMTYGGVAVMVGISGGARAVGNVMAGNFFPLVIPCHRVIRRRRQPRWFRRRSSVEKGATGEGGGRLRRERTRPSGLHPSLYLTSKQTIGFETEPLLRMVFSCFSRP